MYVNNFVLFQLNTLNTLNTYIYHLLPPICSGVCYTTFRETIALFAQEQYTLVMSSLKGWRSWLRHCAAIRKVAGSIPDGVIGIFH